MGVTAACMEDERCGQGLVALLSMGLGSSGRQPGLSIKETGAEGSFEIPGRPFRGPNAAQEAFKHLEKYSRLDPNVASERLHAIKEAAQLAPSDNVIIGRTGDVYNPYTGENIGSLTRHN